MGKTEDLIKSVLSDKKLSDGKIYRDEPLIFTASQMKNYTPPEYGKMKKLITPRDEIFMPSTQIFYKQGKFMENFEDHYDYHGNFIRHFPTYHDMSQLQLRGYFSWRTAVRRGEIKKTSLSFAFVYIYELLNLIGVSSAEDGFFKLVAFAEHYCEIDYRIMPYAERWLLDFMVYYNLPARLLENLYELRNDSALIRLMNYKTEPPDRLLSALDNFSSYKLENSVFYKKHPEETADTVYRLFRALAEYYENRPGGDIFLRLFAKPVKEKYFMFRSAVFYESDPHPDCVYKVNEIYQYICKNGEWSVERFFPLRDKAGKIGALLKNTDYYLRMKYGLKPALKKAETSELFEKMIKEAVNAQYREKLERERPTVNIDISKLQSIRDTADLTRDKLIVDEESEEPPAAAAPPAPEPTAAPAPDDSGLLPPYAEILRCLLTGENGESAARRNGQMLSVAVDAINEILFDRFGDTVIIFNGETPEITEDYKDELKGMLNI